MQYIEEKKISRAFFHFRDFNRLLLSKTAALGNSEGVRGQSTGTS